LTPDQTIDPKYYKDADTGVELESVECLPLTEWLAENYMKFGSEMEFITDKSSEGF